jgi:hypothetical protein
MARWPALSLALVAAASCRPSASPAPKSDAGAPPPAAEAAAPLDACADAAAYEVEVRIADGVATPGPGPFTVSMFGAGAYAPLFPIEGSGEGADAVRCQVIGATPSHVRLECQDGPQRKTADVMLSSGHLDAEVTVDGARTTSSVAVRTCARLVSELPARLTGAGATPAPACPDAPPTATADAYLRRGPADAKTGLRAVTLEVPALHIRSSVGQTFLHDRCRSRVTSRGWVFAQCIDGEGGLSAKVAALRGAIVVVRDDGTKESVATPCATRVVLHPLSCTAPECESPDGPAPSPASSR